MVRSDDTSERKREIRNDQWRSNEKLIDIIEYVLTDSLKPYPGHARIHSRAQRRKLRHNIRKFGHIVPLIVDEKNTIVAGHARHMEAKNLGIKWLPVIRISHLTDNDIKAFRIADNRLVELGEWDEQALALEFEALLEIDFDVELTGFEVPEIDLVLSVEEVIESEQEVFPDIPYGPAITRCGDCWKLGKHRVICGDALDPGTHTALLGDCRADLVFTDPPYNVPVRGHVSGNGKFRHREFAMASGELSASGFFRFLETALKCASQFSAGHALFYVFMDWRSANILQRAAARHCLETINWCVWVKPNGGMGSFYRSRHEFVLVFRKTGASFRNNIELGRFGRNRTNVWEYPGASSIGGDARIVLKDHPTPKPVAMIADAVLDSTRPDDLVLDPFLGGGATLIACERTRRRCEVVPHCWTDRQGS